MEIWIRSQNNKVLILTQSLRIQVAEMKDETRKQTIVGSYGGNEYYLALYDTEKRALEVLDTIQERIMNSKYSTVFEMPKK